MNIAGREIGPGHPCFIVAELSCNHMGEFGNAMRLVTAAAWAGADAVKFQAFTLPEILGLRGDGQAPAPWDAYTKRELYTLAQTPFDWFPKLVAECERVGIRWFSSVMGPESLAMLEDLDCPAYKIAKPEGQNIDLWKMLAGTGKPVITSGDADEMLSDFTIYCPPGYPTPLDAVRLPEEFAGTPYSGLSSHCLAPELPVAAVARGASYLEYHLKLSGTTPLDDAFSHTPESFTAMVDSVRRTEALLA